VVEFNAWMDRNGLSLSAAAKALGITRRTVLYYHGGHKPIPIYIKLACLGWEVLHSQQAA
jgi:predicted transcriptional regulator